MPGQGRSAARQAARSRPLQVLARVGLVAYGVVHVLIAWLALQVAFGQSEEADSSGAFGQIAETPVGRPLLFLLAAGLAAFGLYQAVECALTRQDLKHRVGYGLRAGLFAVLAVTAVRIATGSGGGGTDQPSLTARVLGWPGGQVLVGLLGLATVAVAVALVVRGLRAEFEEELDTAAMSPGVRTATDRLGRAGHVAKGVSLAVVGGFIVTAAATFDPEKSKGLDAALKTLAAQAYGKVLLLVVALGLLCYGLYAFLEARYHRI